MVNFKTYILDNGLTLVVHSDYSTPLVAINVIYNVGSKDESPLRTGFAHLFEHLMFGGTTNVPDFDTPIQFAGGDNNAFTSSDLTSFDTLIPAQNIETALWLESDRMLSLDLSEKNLNIQKKVVIEEYKETCLNQPYGDAWHHLYDMTYSTHPYNWPTIGKVPKHIEEANIYDVKNFFEQYYKPNNAIISIAGSIEPKTAYLLVRKWFDSVPKGIKTTRSLPLEPIQTQKKYKVHNAAVPVDALYMAFHMPDRKHVDYYAIDLLTDILANGPSSRLYRRLLKQQKSFSHVDCHITGHLDPGLIIIEGIPSDGYTIQDLQSKIWEQLNEIKLYGPTEYELQKVKNKIEAHLTFSESNLLHKSFYLAFYQLLGDAGMINDEIKKYQDISVEDIQRVAKEYLNSSNCSILHYRAIDKGEIPLELYNYNSAVL